MADVRTQRPECFERAMDFLGDPEATELRHYIEQLEGAAAGAAAQPAGWFTDAQGNIVPAAAKPVQIDAIKSWVEHYAEENQKAKGQPAVPAGS